MLSYHNNNLELYGYSLNKETSYLEQQLTLSYEKLGHRSGIRAIDISDNDQLSLSGSGEALKVWDNDSFQCIRSFQTGQITAAIFLPKSRYIIAGDKMGQLYLFDINTSEQIQQIAAHEASVWSICYHENPDGWEGIVIISGSADHKLKFWELVVSKTSSTLQLVESKTLYMTDDIHCVKYFPSGKYYAVALLDSSIQIYYSDSDKSFLSLYAHKLPVMSFDVSSDGALIVSGSADKNVKLWGTDFGNCHKSIFAHDGSVTQVKFVRDTHYFFSAGKDNLIKYWDGDTYKLVLTFEECLSEVWSLGVSSIGDFIVAGSNDKLIRVWKQTKEQVFVQEEEERRMEKMMIEDYTTNQLKNEDNEKSQGRKDEASEVTSVGKKKFENLKYGEEIMAAIDLAESLKEDQLKFEEKLMAVFEKKQAESTPSALIADEVEALGGLPKFEKLRNQTIPEYVMNTVASISVTELENSLKFVHFSYLEKIMYYINYYVQNKINLELASRVLYYMLQSNENNILNSKKLLSLLYNIQKHLRAQLEQEKDIVGYNLNSMKIIKSDLASKLSQNDILNDPIFTNRQQFFG